MTNEQKEQIRKLRGSGYGYGNRAYWEMLNSRLSAFAEEQGLRYVRNDDSFAQTFDAPPTIVNFFYHEEVKKSAK